MLFVAAAALFNWRMAIFYVVSVVIATVTARLLNGDRVLLDLGLFGFNSGLMGLALGNFFNPTSHSGSRCWCWPWSSRPRRSRWRRHLPIPFLAAPFIGMFWLMWLLADNISDVIKLDLGPSGRPQMCTWPRRPSPRSARHCSRLR